MKVFILQTGEPLHLDYGSPRPMRAMNLANSLVSNGHDVTLFSSAFDHTNKIHRARQFNKLLINDNLKICLIPSPGYVRNQGLARLYDHAMLAKNLAKQLDEITDTPDVAFVGYPPIEVAYTMTKWLKANGVPHLIDVKDQWPHIFVDSMPKFLKPFARLAFAPYFYLGRKAIANADGITTMADDFLKWTLRFSDRPANANDKVVPLTTPKIPFTDEQKSKARSFWRSQGVDLSRNRVVFAGTITASFDMEPVVTAARYFSKQGAANGNNCDFVFCGDGPLLSKWKRLFDDLDNVYFPGWVDKVQAETLFDDAIAALVPLKNIPNYVGNVPNKVVDALSNGKPILSGLKGTVEHLIKHDGVGLFYGDGDLTLTECIELLLSDPLASLKIKQNANAIYKERYEFESVYQGLVQHLEKLSLLR